MRYILGCIDANIISGHICQAYTVMRCYYSYFTTMRRARNLLLRSVRKVDENEIELYIQVIKWKWNRMIALRDMQLAIMTQHVARLITLFVKIFIISKVTKMHTPKGNLIQSHDWENDAFGSRTMRFSRRYLNKNSFRCIHRPRQDDRRKWTA